MKIIQCTGGCGKHYQVGTLHRDDIPYIDPFCAPPKASALTDHLQAVRYYAGTRPEPDALPGVDASVGIPAPNPTPDN